MTEGRDDDSLDDLDEFEQVWDLGLQRLFDEEEQAEAPDPRTGDHCGRYRLVEEIAQGGMGRVFRALDERLDRDVAVKILRERLRRDDQMTARFLEEARIAAQLQHPGIVPVYDVGLDGQDRPWFSMKLVEGRTLANLLTERSSPDDELARFLGIFAVVCQAVGYAHRRGVIHRDLKPSNVMIGPFGEVQVLDWGFAKVLQALQQARSADPDESADARPAPVVGSDSSRSVSGSVLGTPRYMSPEQARGEIDKLDERTDVFALGGMLCEILCDQPPWGRRIEENPIDRAARGDLSIAEEALANCGADLELVDLARRCLAVEAERRPADAVEVARELTHYLGEAEERTRRARVEAETALASARHERRARYLTVTLGLVLIAIAASAALFVWRRDLERRDDLANRREKLRAVLAEAHEHGLRAEWTQAGDSLERGRLVLGDEAPRALGRELDRARNELETRRDRYEEVAAEQERRREFQTELDRIRLSAMDEPGDGSDDYAACFAAFGCDVATRSPEICYLELVKLPGDTLKTVRLAVDDWASRERAIEARRPPRPGSDEVSTGLLQLAQFLDQDPWRRRLRAAVIDGDEDGLAGIAEEAQQVGIDPNDAVLLATTLQRDDDLETGIAVLLASWRLHPGDAWLNHHLALFLRHEDRSPERRDESAELALRHAHLAMALSPDSPFLRDQVIELTLELGRREEALALIDAWRENIDDQQIGRLSQSLAHDDAVVFLNSVLVERPRSVILHRSLMEEQLRVADLDGAERTARTAFEQVGETPPLVLLLGELLLESGRFLELSDLLAEAGVDPELRRLRDRLQRWRSVVAVGALPETADRRERALLLGLREDHDGALSEWLAILAAPEGDVRVAPGRGPGPGPGPARGLGDGPGGGFGPGPGPGGGLGPGPPPGRGPGRGRRRLAAEPRHRPVRQDALAAVLGRAVEDPDRRSELADAATKALDLIIVRAEARAEAAIREIEGIREDRRIAPALQALAEILPPDEREALEATWRRLISPAAKASR